MRIMWNEDETPLEMHVAAMDGCTYAETGGRLGVTESTIVDWLRKHQVAKRAWDHGQAVRAARVAAKADLVGADQQSLADYVFGQLSPDLRDLWELAVGDDPTGNIDYAISGGIIGRAGLREKQRLYIHALVCSNWNVNTAMQLCGIARRELTGWEANDPDFLQLLEEVQFYKKNYWEQQLNNLVARQDPETVRWVNKTINRDRGYGETVAVQHSGTVAHTGTINHTHLVAVGALDLPVAVLRQVMEAIERASADPVVGKEVRGLDGETVLLPPGVRG